MIQTENFENLSFNPFSIENNLLLHNISDPDINLFNENNLQNMSTPYLSVETTKDKLSEFDESNSLRIIHLNIRSLNKNFEKFKNFLSECSHNFSVICLTETWCTNDSFNSNSNYQLPNYNSVHFERSNNKNGGGICMYVHDTIIHKMRDDLSVSSDDNETLTIEIINKSTKNILISAFYRPPNGKMKSFKAHIKHIFERNLHKNQKMFFLGDYNLNCLDYEKNTKVRSFLNLLFSYGMIPTINKPTRITKNTATAIDNIFINSFFNSSLMTGIIKTDISDHFPIFIATKNIDITTFPQKTTLYKRTINDNSISDFKTELSNTNWSDVMTIRCPNESYNTFLQIFSTIYEKHFPVKTIYIKTKNILSPWITKGLIKSSKQKLYIKFLKKRNDINENNYKSYKTLFEKIKHNSKKTYYSKLLLKHQNNAKKTWSVMKEIIGKSKYDSSSFPRRINIDGTDIYKDNQIANSFNNFFVEIGPKLASTISAGSRSFKTYLNKTNHSIENSQLTSSELKTAFFALKKDKAAGYDDINSGIVLKCYDEVKHVLFHIFDNSIRFGIFPDALKLAKITPILKTGDESLLTNYRPVSVLPVFSKILERIMYNRVYSHLNKYKLLYNKQFGFQNNNSTEHAIIQLINDISNAFDKGEFTLGVFMDLSKAFDTVDHAILQEKLKYYGIKSNTLNWFKSYLYDRKQFISFNDKSTLQSRITCGVPQGSILGPLLFIIYVNDLPISSTTLTPIMFADDTNLFFSHKNLKTLFSTVNKELKNIHEWFKSNKLSLNVKKTHYSLFHPAQKSDDLPLNLPMVKINETTIERERVIKFLGVLLDENLSWTPHINLIKNKISKNLGLLYKARYLINSHGLKQLYFSYVHSYLTYANIAWGSTHKSKLISLYKKQKHALRLIYFKDKLTHTKPLFEKINTMNIFQLNIYNTSKFIFKTQRNLVPSIFHDAFTEKLTKYSLKSSGSYLKPFKKSKLSQFSISYRGPHVWNKIILKDSRLKNVPNVNIFSSRLKKYITSSENNFFDFF